MPPFLVFFFGVESWAVAHGQYRCAVYRLLSEPMSTRLLNSISSRIYNLTCILQHLNSKKVVRSKVLILNALSRQILTNSTAKLSPGAVNRGDVLTACFSDIQSKMSIRMEFVIIMILFDVKDYRLLYGSIWFDIVESVFRTLVCGVLLCFRGLTTDTHLIFVLYFKVYLNNTNKVNYKNIQIYIFYN